MTLPIERARSRRPITWLTIIGVLLLPAIIGGILVAALQNPTGRLDAMTAAVVNLDEPVTIDGQYTPLGRQLAAGLVEGSDEMDSNLTWVISNEDDAAEGLAEGEYQAIVTIPKSFSADATSAGTALQSGDADAQQAEITVTTAPDGRVADGLITQQIASVAASTMGTMLSEATVGNVLVGFKTIGDQIGDAADGAAQLADGAHDAADGAAEIPDGAAQLADGAGGIASGAGELASGASQLAGGLGTISAKTREAGAGANQLGQGLIGGADTLEQNGLVPAELFTAADAAVTASDGAAQAAAGANQASAGVATGVSALAPGLRSLADSCDAAANPQFCTELAAMAGLAESLQQPAVTAEQLSATAADAARGANQASAGTAQGLRALDSEAPKAIADQMRTAGAAATQLGGGLGQLADGVTQSAEGATGIADGASQLGSGATQLGDGVTALGEGAGELATGLDALASGTDDLADGLTTASTSLPSFSDEESTALSSVIADPVASSSDSDAMFGPTTIPLLASVVLWFGALASFIALRAVPGNALTSRRSSLDLVLRGFWPAAAIGAAQGVLVALVVQIVAEYDAATWWGFAGFAVLTGIAFAAVNQALVAVLGGMGRWVSALVGVLALATGVISTVPGWLAGLGAAMPTAPALTGLISPTGAATAGLIVWAVLSLGAAILAVSTRRTTSAKRVLATA
ncbi:YhgE/Pip domain-containing protein [Microbacterium esteraromaticum]|uniref:YhgE/Pip domain-containing protein n=1 Tax=Microbacterium esteraromaticum TaxID=57043 RepID=UPI001C95692E|nr:YhgE/Pip family protein [Microbacterium esteraromaticum]MBY6060218.1 YhgE/Pip family protein [Microbacterium esteraromaticum]